MTTHSGDTSPGGSNSLSNSSVRTRTSEDSQAIPHKSFHLGCYNSSPEQDDDGDDHCDEETLSQLMLHSDLFRRGVSIGVQTDYNEDFPPLKFLRALGEDPTGIMNQQPFYFTSGGSEVPISQNLNQLPISTLSTNSTTTASTLNTSGADASSSSSDGTLQLVIQNFRHMSDTVRGPCKYIQGVPWRIMVMPRQHVVQKKGTQKCLGFFLQCCPDAYSESWSCQASAELRLISQKSSIPNFIRKTNHVYTAKENDWGYSCFMTWADILDESQGYIKDDKVTLEVQVKAEPPKNILTHSEFKKKIQDYKRLADLQCQRGLIDKAIECNTQALKFCKDKDPQCKIELETQKAHLIDMKLKQSIQRIEKVNLGNDGSKIDDDTSTNLNALRQALGTTTRCNAAKSTKNKSTSTKDTATATNNQNSILSDKHQRAGTPPYTTQKLPDSPKQQVDGTVEKAIQQKVKQIQKTPRLVEPQSQEASVTMGTTIIKDDEQRKKRLYKSVSTQEIFCAAGSKCKGHLNSKALVALSHFNNAILKSDDFDYMKDQYQEEEDLLPDQIQHFLKHLSEGDKSATRLKDQISKLEMIASPFEKPDPFLEELMKLDPKEADKALVKAITFATLERENDPDRDNMNANQLEKYLSKVIRDKFCESCLREGHLKIEKRETSEFGCQTEFARRIPREVPSDETTLRIMQQFQQQQLIGQQTNEEYINALKNQAFALAAAQQQQQQQQNQAIMKVPVPTLPTRRKKATAKKNLQQQVQQNYQQQNLLQQQQFQQFIPTNQRIQMDNNQTGCIDTIGLDLNDPHMEMFAATTKPLMQTQGIDMNMAALTNLDLGRIQFPVEPTMTDPNQLSSNIFSRQYIEEWLRYNTRNLLKTNYDSNEKPQPQQPIGIAGTVLTTNCENLSAATSQIYNPTPEIQNYNNTSAALIQLNCLNARNIQQKIAEFVDALETHANFRDMRNSIDRLLTLCADNEHFTNTEDTVSVVSASECSGKDLDLTKDHLQDSIQRSFIDEDPHDYMLLRELKQSEMVLATRLNSILYQLHQASISDIVDRLESKIKVLDEKIRISKSECTSLKNNDKKVTEQLNIVQREFHNLNGKYEKLIQQLKDRKNEIKKLEKKAKSEAQLAAENTELQEKFDAMKKELSQAQRQLADEQAKYKRDTQSLADSKKHLSVELNTKYSELQKVTNQLEERTQALKKMESQLANERKNNAQTVTNLNERVRRAEVNLLEHKLEDGLRVLERAKDDCAYQIKLLEELQLKRNTPPDLEIIRKNIGEWENKRQEVSALIGQAKTDFQAHIQSVKSGKQLSQLPKIQVPKPPPFPKIHPMPAPPHQTTGVTQPQVSSSSLSLDRKVITPPSRSRTGAITPTTNPITTTSSSQQLPSNQMIASPAKTVAPIQFFPPGITSGAFQSGTPPTNVTPVKGSFQPQPMISQPPPTIGHVLHPPIAPIGVRPSNYQNGISIPPLPTQYKLSQQGQRQSPLNTLMTTNQVQNTPPPAQHQQFNVPNTLLSQTTQQQQQQTSNAASGQFQTWNGGWGDQLNNISELFGQGRSFGPLGSDFGKK